MQTSPRSEQARALLEAGRIAATLETLDTWETELASAPDGDPRRGQLLELQIRALKLRGGEDSWRAQARQLLRLTREHGWPQRGRALLFAADSEPEWGRALALADEAIATSAESGDLLGELEGIHSRSRILRSRGQLAEAEAELAAAIQRAEHSQDDHTLATLVLAHIGTLQFLERMDEARAQCARATRLCDRLPTLRGHAMLAQGRMAKSEGDLDRAQQLVGQAIEALGEQERVVAGAFNTLGEIQRLGGDLVAAEASYRAILDLARSSLDITVTRLNLSMVLDARGDAEGALAELEPLAGHRLGRMEMAWHVCHLPPAASLGRWVVFDAHEQSAQRLSASGASAMADGARLLEQAADTAEGGAKLGRAVRATALATTHYDRTGNAAGLARCEARLGRLAALGARIPLGEFDLQHTIGAGAMGRVWLATHRGSGHPVAVKVIAAGERAEAAWKALEREVRALAGLWHPAIVRAFDMGSIDLAAASMAPAQLVKDSPYLVMELVEGGSLSSSCGVLPWPEVRAVLDELLVGLAHAHGHGLLHRDIKPDNVLLTAQGRVRLTDFGLAAVTAQLSTDRIAGTPAYMSPEQVSGDVARMGPWSDLYSLGCTAWALVTGQPPFSGSIPEVFMAQLGAEPGPLRPAIAVPTKLEGWLLRLLAKAPEGRFARAADALAALRALGPATVKALSSSKEALASAETFVLDVQGSSSPAGAPWASLAPELPEHWEVRPPPPRPFDDVGLAFFSVREPVFVEREAEGEWLWQALRSGRPALRCVQGPEGIGCSRLLAELAHRAHVAGAWVAALDPQRPVERAVALALTRLLGWSRLGGNELIEAVGAISGPNALQVALALEGLELDRPATRLALGLLLGDLALRRPVVLTLDDADPAALASAEALVASVAEGRVLVAVATRPGEEISSARRLEGLTPDGMSRMIQSYAALDPDFERRALDRAAGNPGFALEIVQDHLERGALVPGPRGYGVRHGYSAGLPSDLSSAWKERAGRVVAELREEHRRLLYVAAGLGTVVDDLTWSAAAPDDRGLVDLLAGRGLARRTPGGWRFEHAAFREAVAQQLRGQAARDVHEACAAALGPAHRARRGRHLLLAQHHDEAFDDLMAGADEAQRRGDMVDARATLDLALAALSSAAPPDADPRWATARLRRVQLMLRSGGNQEAIAEAEALVRDAEGNGWRREGARARSELGAALYEAGRGAEAREHLLRALDELAEYPDLQGPTLQALSAQAITEGRWGDALELLGRAEAAGHDRLSVEYQRGRVAQLRDDPDGAQRHYAEVAQLARDQGRSVDLARALNALSGFLPPDRARPTLSEASRLLRAAGDRRAVFPLVNLGLLAAGDSDWNEAGARLRTARELAVSMGQLRVAGDVACMLVAVHALADDEPAFVEHYPVALAWRARHRVPPDVTSLLRRAHDRCSRVGLEDMAERLGRLLDAQ